MPHLRERGESGGCQSQWHKLPVHDGPDLTGANVGKEGRVLPKPVRRSAPDSTAPYTLDMKNALSDKRASTPKSKVKAHPLDGLQFVEVGGGSRGPAPDAKRRLAAFYAKYPLRTLNRGERGIVEGLKADRDRR